MQIILNKVFAILGVFFNILFHTLSLIGERLEIAAYTTQACNFKAGFIIIALWKCSCATRRGIKENLPLVVQF